VIGGYVPSGRNFDTLIFGYYDDQGQLRFAAKTRNGFTPASRNQVFKRLQSVPTGTCPFVNLPEKKPGRWSQGITAEKIGECVWLEPKQVRDRHVSPSSWHPFCKSPGHKRGGRFSTHTSALKHRAEKGLWVVMRAKIQTSSATVVQPSGVSPLGHKFWNETE
jgi:hypothetical protein